jgi:hypothetical protein
VYTGRNNFEIHSIAYHRSTLPLPLHISTKQLQLASSFEIAILFQFHLDYYLPPSFVPPTYTKMLEQAR